MPERGAFRSVPITRELPGHRHPCRHVGTERLGTLHPPLTPSFAYTIGSPGWRPGGPTVMTTSPRWRHENDDARGFEADRPARAEMSTQGSCRAAASPRPEHRHGGCCRQHTTMSDARAATLSLISSAKNIEVARGGHVAFLSSARIASIIRQELESMEPPGAARYRFACTASPVAATADERAPSPARAA